MSHLLLFPPERVFRCEFGNCAKASDGLFKMLDGRRRHLCHVHRPKKSDGSSTPDRSEP